MESTDSPLAFDSVKKIQFLKLAHEIRERTGSVPTIASLCDAVGISLSAFQAHKKLDEQFNAQWRELLYRVEDKLIDTMYQNGLKSSGYMDRITWLRRHFPENWAPEQRITVTHSQQYIDTTLEHVEAYEGGLPPTHGTDSSTVKALETGHSQGNVTGGTDVSSPPTEKTPPPLPHHG